MKRVQRDLPDNLENLLHQGFRYALSLTHEGSLAEDLVQDACMKMVKASKPWHKGYFFTTIRNRYIDVYRRIKKLPVQYLDTMEQADRMSGFTEQSNAEADLSNAEILEKVLGKISSTEREALYLYAVEGYTAKEISKLTRTPRNTVLSHINRARGKLADLLNNENISSKVLP